MNWVAPIKDEQTLEMYKSTLLSMDPKYYILFEIGVGTGMQLLEMLKLKVSDVKGKDELVAYIGTRNIKRTFRFTPQFKKVVDEYTKNMSPNAYLFRGTKDNCPISREQAYRSLREAGKRIGLTSIGSQTMRKTFAWKYYNSTGDIYYLTNLLNHASPTVTYRYIGVKPAVDTVVGKMTPKENERARQSLYEDGSGVKRMEAVCDTMHELEKQMENPMNNDAFYGRVDSLLTQIEELIEGFNASRT